jgi:hypothetical protein
VAKERLLGHDQSNGQRIRTNVRVSAELASLTFQSIAVGDRFEFHANGVGDGNDGVSFECESRQHRTELMHFERVIAFHQHIPAPITDANDERVDLEIGWRLPRAEDLQDSLPLCANIGETSCPSTITVGRGKKSHLDEHKQDKYFFRCVGSFGA